VTKIRSEDIAMNEAWQFRPDTLDQAIFNGVVLFNEYGLPARFDATDIIIDVGSHIGSFAEAALSRGCENVFCVEADRSNLEIAEVNLKAHLAAGRVRLMRGAVWRSDPNKDELYFDGYHNFPDSFPGMQGVINTGNGSVLWSRGEPVKKIPFDEIVNLLTHNGNKRVRLLKLDCEGAEWPILLTSRRLALIDEICGEFHEIGGQYLEISEDRSTTEPIFSYQGSAIFTIDLLLDYLSQAGFSVTYKRHSRPTGEPEGLGLFFATRNATTSQMEDDSI
jgi:FkbM family methyltransferase